MNELQSALNRRKENGDTAYRVFHGPGEGTELVDFAVDRFDSFYWITQWESAQKTDRLKDITAFISSLPGAKGAVLLYRPLQGTPEDARVVWGEAPPSSFTVLEQGVKFEIRLQAVKHPGLFLDHAPLRKWLIENARDRSVLNTFAYTGSLSVAAGFGGAKEVVTLDLSRPTVQWAEENWKLNALSSASDFIYGDYFEWLPRLKKQGRKFEIVILDPPSFSRGKKQKTFSTSKDLVALHQLALQVLAPQGTLITSINSSNVSWKKYRAEVEEASRLENRKLQEIARVELPESFPLRKGEEAYLKGFYLTSSQ